MVQNQRNGPNGVVVGRNVQIAVIRITVGIHNSNNGDAHAVCFANSFALSLGVNDNHGARQTEHVPDAVQVAEQLGLFTIEASEFFFGQYRSTTFFLALLHILKVSDSRTDYLKVRQRATDPTVTDVWHSSFIS